MKKIKLFGCLSVLLCAVGFGVNVNAEEVDTSYIYDWLKNTDMVVTEENKSGDTNKNLNGVSTGSVLLSYSYVNENYINPRELTTAIAETGKALLKAYEKTGEQVYLDRAILIGENIITNGTIVAEYAHSASTEGVELTLLRGGSMKNGVWTWSDRPECHSVGEFLESEFLIRLSALSGDSRFAELGLKVIDSWEYIGSRFSSAYAGGFPQYVYYADHSVITWGEGMYPVWVASTANSYGVYTSMHAAYDYTGEQKYMDYLDNYMAFERRMFTDYNGVFSFEKDGETYLLPYEYVKSVNGVIQGVNCSNQTGKCSNQTDITSDQLFEAVLGYVYYNKDDYYAKEFVKTLKALSFDNGLFYGEYSIDGGMGQSSDLEIEIINSGFYLDLLRFLGRETEADLVEEMLLSYMYESENNNIDGAYGWAVGGDNTFAVESFATSVILQSLTYRVVIPEETIPEEDEPEEIPEEEPEETPEEVPEEIVEDDVVDEGMEDDEDVPEIIVPNTGKAEREVSEVDNSVLGYCFGVIFSIVLMLIVIRDTVKTDK